MASADNITITDFSKPHDITTDAAHIIKIIMLSAIFFMFSLTFTSVNLIIKNDKCHFILLTFRT